MTPLDHLVAALVQLEQQAQEIEHRQSYIRSAIESFGIDADDALLVAVHDDAPGVGVGIWPGKITCITEDADGLRIRAERLADIAPATEVQDSAVGWKLPNSNQWDWPKVAAEIRTADDLCARRARHLQDTIGVSPATAQWMMKRCRELSLIDVERPKFDQQKARDAAAAAI